MLTLSRIESDSQICREYKADMSALQVQVQMFEGSSCKSVEAGNSVGRGALGKLLELFWRLQPVLHFTSLAVPPLLVTLALR